MTALLHALLIIAAGLAVLFWAMWIVSGSDRPRPRKAKRHPAAVPGDVQ